MSFYGVTDIWTYVLGALCIILLPGPNSMYVLSVACVRGVRPAYQAACGVFLGDTVLLLLIALGVSGVLHSFPALFAVAKYAGAAYLCWIGLNLLRAALRGWNAQDEAALARGPGPAGRAGAQLSRPFRRALLVSLFNPKAILFLLSFFVQFIDPAYANPALPFLILASIMMAFSALYLSALIFLGARLAQAMSARKRLAASLSSAVGCVFLWFGTRLASASLN